VRVSVVIYTENSEETLPQLLERLGPQEINEVIIADAGSRDSTVAIGRQFGANISRGHVGHPADVLNAGAQLASFEVLWFLTANSLVPIDGASRILDLVEETRCVAGQFKVRDTAKGLLESAGDSLSTLFNASSGPATGLFVLREVLYGLRGFAQNDHPLNELLQRAGQVGEIGDVRQTIKLCGSSPL
jgi:glycosyltransferase involved in cell wall biosynthesis